MQMKIVKKQMLRFLAFVMAVCLIAVSFVGCGKEQNTNAYRSINEVVLESQVLASNTDYELQWDNDARAILYKNKSDGDAYWSDILYDKFLDGSVGSNGKSPIYITVVDNKKLDWRTISSNSQMGTAGNIVCKKIDGGIRVTYFFEDYKIAVPVDYKLESDHIKISVDSSKILEDGSDYKLVSVSVAPNLCAIENSAKNGNLFVPTGTGALIKTKETAVGSLNYEGEVFGQDSASRVPISKKDDEAIRLPVFGSYGNGRAMLGIIESAQGAATIVAEGANPRTGYSLVYPKFFVRGYDNFMYEHYGQNVFRTTSRVNDDISGQVFTVAYYPLYDAQADYNGMAKKYQSYLIEKGELKKTEKAVSPYSVTFLGGTNITKSFFGIPYRKLVSLTTFEEAKNILEQLKTSVGVLPEVRLLGYSDNGLRAGTIAGGSSYPSAYGSKKDLKALIEYCKETNLFLDSDIINFSESGNGFSLTYDVAKTAIMYKAENFPLSPTRVQDTENKYYVVSRDELLKAGDKALAKAKKYSANAVSFSSLGEIAYSDYSDNKYINRNEMDKDAKKMISSAKESGYMTAVASGNSYAACAADLVFDVSATSGKYDVFDCDIPFYQMVFSSYKPLYSKPVNNAKNVKEEIAKAVAYGMGVSYYLTDGYVSMSDDLSEYKLYSTLFEDNIDDIKNTLNGGFIKQYDAVKNSALTGFEFVNSAVVKSVFSNGVVIYTNLSTKEAQSPVGKLQPYEYKLG